MLLDPSQQREPTRDQAEGLRQLRKPDSPPPATVSGSARVLKWPRIVLISEFPSTDVGARFAFHLASALGASHPGPQLNPQLGSPTSSGGARQSLLLDLAPAASRLPQVLSDRLPADLYPALWSEMAAGRTLGTLDIAGHAPLAVAAEDKLVPAVLEQLPRLYEQLVRQLSRAGERWGWIVMLGLDHIVPLDRTCWQAADDIVLLGGAGATAGQRQLAALRSRLSELEPERSLWTLPKRQMNWFGRRAASSLSSHWLEAGLAPKLLPTVSWPQMALDAGLVSGSRADHMLRRSALRVAERLQASANSPLLPIAKSA